VPEGPEIRIMSDFINSTCKNKIFKSAYHVAKGNQPSYFDEDLDDGFRIHSSFYGKILLLFIKSNKLEIPMFVFMGMSGSWELVDTDIWNQTKFTRLRFDSNDGKSLLLYGGYMGPKYKLYQNFDGNKSGPCMIIDFDKFKKNITDSMESKSFNKPIYEVLLDQRYFNGIGNYLRSTILYYADVNPFLSANVIIKENPNFLELCRDVSNKSYTLNGGQLKDWTNPFQKESQEFHEWVFYKKGTSIKDSGNRTFWFDPKWDK